MEIAGKRRWNIRNHPKFLWIITNMLGMLVAGVDYIGFMNSHVTSNNPPLFRLLLYPITAGLIFGFFQFVYIKIYVKGQSPWNWALKTILAIILIFAVNFFILPSVVFPWLANIFAKIYLLVGGSSISVFAGIEIYAMDSILPAILFACLFGTILGGSSGLILGFLQSSEIADRELARTWLYATLISICLGFVINSVFFTITSNMFYPITIIKLRSVPAAFIGLLYGLGTEKMMHKNLSTKNGDKAKAV